MDKFLLPYKCMLPLLDMLPCGELAWLATRGEPRQRHHGPWGTKKPWQSALPSVPDNPSLFKSPNHPLAVKSIRRSDRQKKPPIGTKTTLVLPCTQSLLVIHQNHLYILSPASYHMKKFHPNMWSLLPPYLPYITNILSWGDSRHQVEGCYD